MNQHLKSKASAYPAAPGLREPYTDEYTGATYTLNTKTLSWADAEAQCNELGGHVVCYGGIAEQVAVEMFYATTKVGRLAAHCRRLAALVVAGIPLVHVCCQNSRRAGVTPSAAAAAAAAGPLPAVVPQGLLARPKRHAARPGTRCQWHHQQDVGVGGRRDAAA